MKIDSWLRARPCTTKCVCVCVCVVLWLVSCSTRLLQGSGKLTVMCQQACQRQLPQNSFQAFRRKKGSMINISWLVSQLGSW